ncbi:O-antigen ligase [uncultured Clostridium sp.]|jgi:uncharacterized membrane protein YidH (DUF202 family)|uniref:O-antigen ligase family protein n=1 Tax=uncultured Clostridium sp. TaxID=59620 RepID=UPI00259AABB3|nr:O-antigen ligase family protein [uncultured Clostridium sp.]
MKELINRYKWLILFGIIIEAVFLGVMWGSEAKLTTLIGALMIPAVIIILVYMAKSLENTLITVAFTIPLLPLIGYVMLRLNLLNLQWVAYVLYYIVVAALLIKNGLLKKLDGKNIKVKDKYLRIALMILLVVNIFFAFNKGLSLMIVLLSFVPFILYTYILRALNYKNKGEFLNKILIALSLGCIFSSIPDILYFFMTWAQGDKNIRIFGPLGSNFILIYDLLILIIILAKWANIKGIKNIWCWLAVAMSFIISMQLSRGAWISFMLIFLMFLIFNISNWKRYIAIILVFGSMLTYNVFQRPDVANDSNLHEVQEIITGNAHESKLESNSAFSDIIKKVLESQSKTRQILWKAGIDITADYPYTGVGIGNFKYFYQEYSGSERPYSDAHNIFLNMSTELGVPFMILGMILLVIVGLTSLINYFKNKDNRLKKSYLALMTIAGIVLVYGNLTGIAFQTTNEIYSFTPTFIFTFILLYRDYIEEFSI